MNLADVGAPCDDDDPSTAADSCTADGACGGEPIVCPVHACVASSTPNGGGCDVVLVPVGSPCDDGAFATHTDTCDEQGGCQGTPYDCQPEPCELTSTPDGVGCEVVFAEAGTLCDDGEPATQSDTCDGQGGCQGSVYDCQPGLCELTSTPDGGGCEVVFSEVGAACDDSDPSTHHDVCDGAGACGGQQVFAIFAPCAVGAEGGWTVRATLGPAPDGLSPLQ